MSEVVSKTKGRSGRDVAGGLNNSEENSTENNSPYVTKPVKKIIWRLALPAMGGMLLQDVFTLVDMMWVGRLGSSAVAAVTFASIYVGFIFMIGMGISSGTAALVSRRVGSGDLHGAAKVVGQSLFLAFIASILTAILGITFAESLIRALGAAEDVIADAASYLTIMAAGSFTIFAMISFNVSFRASGDAMLPLRATMVSATANILLDPILIFGLGGLPELGVAGSAMATIVGRGLGLIILLRGARTHEAIRFSFRDLIPDPAIFMRIIRIGIFSSGQMTVRNVSALLMNRVVAAFGTSAIAAYGIGLRLTMAIGMPAFGMGMAAGTMVGQNLGAKKPERAREAGWYGTFVMTGIVVFISILYSLIPESLISVFNSEKDVIEIGVSMLRYIALTLPFMVTSIVLSRSLDGAGDTITTLKITAASLIFIQVPGAYYLADIINSPTGVWMAILGGAMTHAIFSATCFHRGKWALKAVD